MHVLCGTLPKYEQVPSFYDCFLKEELEKDENVVITPRERNILASTTRDRIWKLVIFENTAPISMNNRIAQPTI